MIERQRLESSIDALSAQRDVLGATLVEAALAPLRARLTELDAESALSVSRTDTSQALKQVTILFLDVVGSTSLSQSLDPEDVQGVMDGALTRFTQVVASHQGRVLNYAGDSLLAVFGADEVHEDDAERAVRTGLLLLEEGRRQGQRVLQRHGLSDFNVRVGVHTGVVLLGGGIDGDDNIRGFAVNVAARMEQSAPSGGLRISHDTYCHIRGIFDVTQQAPIEVKGVVEPMLTYLVQRCKPRAFRVIGRGVEGVETQMIGRERELEQLQRAYQRLHQQSKLCIIMIVSEAGLGKSRLLYEFQNWAETRPERFILFRGRAHPSTQSQPYGLLRDMLAWRLQIGDGDSLALARKKFEDGIEPMFVVGSGADMAQGHTHLLGHLIGIDFSASRHILGIQEDSQQLRSRGFHAAALLLRRIAAQSNKPIVVLLDDLHWADDGSLDFLHYFLQVNADVPILLLGLARPALFERRPDWPGTSATQRIALTALDEDSSQRLVSELLKKMPDPPAALRALISAGAEGNPYYMEELLKMLVDEGAIVVAAARWHLNLTKMQTVRVPQTLTGVLQSRLDSLQPSEKLALQHASVIGQVFWDQALAAIDSHSVSQLAAVMRRDLVIQREQTGLDGVREFVFKHQLLHQVIYSTVLKSARRQWHGTTAVWLAAFTGAGANNFLGLTAEHFEQAGDNAQAAEFFSRAAEHAAARHAHEAVLNYVAKALVLTAETPLREQQVQRWRLLDMRERTLDLCGRRLEQQIDIQALQALADTLDDDRRRADAARRLSTFAMRTGDYPGMQSAARQTIACAGRAGDDLLGLRGQHRLALALTYLGDATRGRALAEAGLNRSRALGARQLEALFLNALSVIADSATGGLPSLEMDEQDLRINRELGNRRHEAIALGNLGSGWLRLGDPLQAQRFLEEGLRLAQAVGDRATQPDALANLSVLALRQGDALLARRHAQAALEIALAVQSPEFEAIALCALGNAELALGQQAAAKNNFERALALAQGLDNASQHDARAGLARALLGLGEVSAAQREVELLLSHLGRPPALEGSRAPLLIRLTCYQVLTRAQDPRAPVLLQGAHAALQALAASLCDPELRHSFLQNIPEHRAILAASSGAPRELRDE